MCVYGLIDKSYPQRGFFLSSRFDKSILKVIKIRITPKVSIFQCNSNVAVDAYLSLWISGYLNWYSWWKLWFWYIWPTEFWPTRILTDRILTDRISTDKNFDRQEFWLTEFWPTRILTDRILTDRIFTDRILTDRILTDRILTDENFDRQEFSPTEYSPTETTQSKQFWKSRKISWENAFLYLVFKFFYKKQNLS
jgi:hypothetical protein